MSRYVVWVEFDIDPEKFAAFMPLMETNAKASFNDEVGCQQFDLLRPADKPNAVALYEIYDDKAAFDVHLKSPHFLKFAEATKDMIVARRISTFHLD
ncbi:autoinducer 2-degrading protein LsrG [Variibacter gotjawalensis]|uniref:Autoinducer 2-degrading protein LsrG n=1 Tax=Variibacter gotjawalensis TaxID=1333996 RepID=A0A0S3PXM7_9BRAD|nr:putative quinol monooxygenase [Variibacter gotjawalensis]NIK46511.1 quinol monooxygenase YgiN [Variibacter gotjawalensis]RZS48419.1 quinol monooxygenase YgiN [Variibacter gotjawalensis]BAT60678.1 autoinducer 2-degrading protein LsrG [Variibacter gotjawalensis]